MELAQQSEWSREGQAPNAVKGGPSTHRECCLGHVEGLEEARMAQSLGLQSYSQVGVIGQCTHGETTRPRFAAADRGLGDLGEFKLCLAGGCLVQECYNCKPDRTL